MEMSKTSQLRYISVAADAETIHLVATKFGTPQDAANMVHTNPAFEKPEEVNLSLVVIFQEGRKETYGVPRRYCKIRHPTPKSRTQKPW
jgi:hypothetical protein